VIIYAAGSGESQRNEELMLESGLLRNRLLSFAFADNWQRDVFKLWCEERERVTKMILYAAGNVVSQRAELEMLAGGCLSNHLLTYADVDTWAKAAFEFWTSQDRPYPSRLFLDSGAFSVDSRGAKIDLEQYCDFILQRKAYFEVYATLDVIGDWRGTARNYDKMAAKGLSPLPTFHQGSPWHEMERMAKSYPYIALGRLQQVSRKGQEQFQGWLDQAFRRLAPYWPVKVHLFGITAQWVMERYPVYSVDSSTAIAAAGRGGIVQRFINGEAISRRWQEDGRLLLDGEIMDGISSSRAAGGSAHMGRRLQNLATAHAIERYITDLWTNRGVVWN
jgi:hypothetical protein